MVAPLSSTSYCPGTRSVSYSVDYQGAQRGVHVLADLVPGQYDVLLNGATITTVTASSQGVATFSSNSGGTFALRFKSSASAPQPPTNLRFVAAPPPSKS